MVVAEVEKQQMVMAAVERQQMAEAELSDSK